MLRIQSRSKAVEGHVWFITDQPLHPFAESCRHSLRSVPAKALNSRVMGLFYFMDNINLGTSLILLLLLRPQPPIHPNKYPAPWGMTLMEHLGNQMCRFAAGGPNQTSHSLDSNPGPLPSKVPVPLILSPVWGAYLPQRALGGLNECMQVNFKTGPISSQLVVIIPYDYYFALVSLCIFFTFLWYLYL